MLEKVDNSEQTPGDSINLHPLFKSSMADLSEEELVYLKDRNFEHVCEQELEILSANLKLLESPEGKNRIKILRDSLESENLIPEDSSDQQVLSCLIKRSIQMTVDMDKRYFKNNRSYDPYPGRQLRVSGIQLARQGLHF